MILSIFMSEATNEIVTNDIEKTLEAECQNENIELALAKAIMYTESKGYSNAMRYESHLKKAGWYKLLLSEEEKTNDYCYFSMGLFQQLYGMVKHYGFKGTVHELMNPKESIKYALKHIKALIQKWYNVEKVISAYNQGTPKKDINGVFKNQDYVDKVLKYYKKFGGKIAINRNREKN